MDGDDSGAGSATQDPRAPRPQSSRSIPWVLAAGTVILALVAGVIGGLIGYAIHPSSGSASSNIGCDVTAVTSKVLPRWSPSTSKSSEGHRVRVGDQQ